MTDAEFAATEARVDALLDEWMVLLGLKHLWKLNCYYHRDRGEYAASFDDVPAPKGGGSVAWVHATWPYLQASIHLNMPAFATQDAEDQEETIIHELVHIILVEMQDGTHCLCPYDIQHEERACTMLARAFLRAKNAQGADAVASDAAVPSEKDQAAVPGLVKSLPPSKEGR